MGHRAYVAYEVSNGVYDVHFTQWGASNMKLVEEINNDNLYGGECSSPDYLDEFLDLLEDGTEGEVEKNFQENTDVNPYPELQGVSIHEIIHDIQESIGIEVLYIATKSENEVEVYGYRVIDVPETEDIVLVNHKPIKDQAVKNYYRGMRDMCNQFENSDQYNIFMDALIEDMSGKLDGHVLAASPAIRIDDYYENPEAFFDIRGERRLFGEMVVTSLKNIQEWQNKPNKAGREKGIFEIETPKTLREIEEKEISKSKVEEISPKIQFPLGKSGLTINGAHYKLHELPQELTELYHDYYESLKKNKTKVYECDECGFITQSTKVGDYKGYTCNNCETTLSSQRNYNILFNQFKGNPKDIANIDPEEVPNSKKHLNQIKSSFEDGIQKSEFIEEAEKVVAKYEVEFGGISQKNKTKPEKNL